MHNSALNKNEENVRGCNSEGSKCLDCKATDNEYLHKDFHGALCYAIKYLDDNFGADAVREYLVQVTENCYSHLIGKIKIEGLKAIEEHWREILTREDGVFEIRYEDNTLIINVTECPAIAYMKMRNIFYTPRYCQTTVVFNETICAHTGYKCCCEYQLETGKCVQKFWKL